MIALDPIVSIDLPVGCDYSTQPSSVLCLKFGPGVIVCLFPDLANGRKEERVGWNTEHHLEPEWNGGTGEWKRSLQQVRRLARAVGA